jgi:multiple sugar transport system permease protein
MAKKKLGTSVLTSVKQRRQAYVLLAPFFLLFFLFTVLPVLTSIVIGFTNFNMIQIPSFVGWENYIRLFLDDDIYIIALRNTLVFALITGPLSYVMCFTFAWVINELPPKLRAFMTLVLYAPSLAGSAIGIFAILFSSDAAGWANAFLLTNGFITEPIRFFQDANYIMILLIIVQLWLSLGTAFLAFIAGLQTVDPQQYEAGAIDGLQNRWQELWYITLPNMIPMLMFGAVMQITNAFAVSSISTTLAGNPSVNYAGATLVTHLQDFGSIRFEMGYASAQATILFVVMIGANKGVQKILAKVGR